MRRPTPFERDFRDLHGAIPHLRVEIVQEQPRPRNPLMLGLVLGSLGLFWSLVLSAALLVMLIVGGIFTWALFATPPL